MNLYLQTAKGVILIKHPFDLESLFTFATFENISLGFGSSSSAISKALLVVVPISTHIT
jgi:hypothetical protein